MGPANLTLVYSNVTGYDAVTDKDITETVTITASVREMRDEQKMNAIGAGFYDIFLEGRLVDPKQLPQGIGLEDEAQATLVSGGRIQKGKFRLLPFTENRFPEYGEAVGGYIQGLMSVTGAV